MMLEILGIVVALIAGAAGWSAIYAYFVQARVYGDSRHYRFVGLSDERRRTEIERALAAAGLPTAMLEVVWWNRGKRTQKECPST